MSKNSIRSVGNREIYNSYMGILRISPDENYNDDITDSLKNTDSEIKLSDSNGNELNLFFKPKVKEIKNFENINEDFYFMESNTNYYSITESLNVRNFLVIDNNLSNDFNKLSSLVIIDKTKNGILTFPIESPHDKNYFNSNNKLELLNDDIKPNKGRYEYVQNKLKNKSLYWYKENISENHRVKVNNKTLFYSNDKDELIPVVKMKDYVLGHYEGHNSDDIVKNGDANSRLEKIKEIANIDNLDDLNLDEKLKVTKLSWLDIDQIIWDELDGIMNGNTRDNEGRYANLGVDNIDIILKPNNKTNFFNSEKEIESSYYPDKKNNRLLRNVSPILGVPVQPGLIVYNAMPLKRLIFHNLRQAFCNEKELDKEASYYNEVNGKSCLKNVKINYKRNGEVITKISPIKRYNSGFINSLTKNFLICNGKEINYDNFQNINILNDGLISFDKNNKSVSIKENPLQIYEALKSSRNNTFKTIPLLNFGTISNKSGEEILYSSNRYIRGLNWERDTDTIWDVNDSEQESFKNTNNGNFKTYTDYPTEWIMKKNISDIKLYYSDYSIKCKTNRHYHYMFNNGSSIQDNTKKEATECFNKLANGYRRLMDKRLPVFEQYPYEPTPYNSKQEEDDYVTYHCQKLPDIRNVGAKRVKRPITADWLNYCFSINTSYTERGYKPIKNAAYYLQADEALANDLDFEIQNETKERFIASEVFKENEEPDYEKLKKINDVEGRVPFTVIGGAPYDGEEGYFRGTWRHEIFIQTLKSYGYGYSLKTHPDADLRKINYNGSMTDENKEKYRGDDIENKYIYRCVSSLAKTNQDSLGRVEADNTMVKNEINFISTNDNLNYSNYKATHSKDNPNPPSINLIPLMRI